MVYRVIIFRLNLFSMSLIKILRDLPNHRLSHLIPKYALGYTKDSWITFLYYHQFFFAGLGGYPAARTDMREGSTQE